MQGEVGTPAEAVVIVAQLAEELLYRAEALLYLVDLALTGLWSAMVGVSFAVYDLARDEVRNMAGVGLDDEREIHERDGLLRRYQDPLPGLPGLLARAG